jgi:hypothetical protein
MTRYGLQGHVSGELLSYRGKVLVHDNADELRFLVSKATVIVMPSDIPPEQTLPIWAHPELASVRFPLRREDFK